MDGNSPKHLDREMERGKTKQDSEGRRCIKSEKNAGKRIEEVNKGENMKHTNGKTPLSGQ